MNHELILGFCLVGCFCFGAGMVVAWVLFIGQYQIPIPGERFPLEAPAGGNSIFEIRHRRGGMILKLDCWNFAVVHLTAQGIFVPLEDLRVFVDREEQFPKTPQDLFAANYRTTSP